MVQTEADWLRDIDEELPFPRNVEAEGVQIYPVHRAARRPPGDRPPVTRKGIRHAVPVWLTEARRDLEVLKHEIDLLKNRRIQGPGIVARPAFDPVFFSTMAWRLTRGVSVVRRKDLPMSVERALDRTRAGGTRMARSHPNALGGLEGGSRLGTPPRLRRRRERGRSHACRPLETAARAVLPDPRREILVLGNHELRGGIVRGLVRRGLQNAVGVGELALVLTQVPVRDVLDGCRNVHGHVHRWVPAGPGAST